MSQVWGVTMVRDEEDIIAPTLDQLVAEGVDGLVIADNNSVDRTREILDAFARSSDIPVIIVEDSEVGYEQSRKMTALAHVAHGQGADWIIPFDADECWYSTGDRLAVMLRALDVVAIKAPLFNHFRTALDTDDANPFRSIPYRQTAPGALPKVVCRWADDLVIGMGNHSVTYGGEDRSTTVAWAELRHFPYRSAAQMIRKARNGAQAYAATSFDPSVGAHWRQYNALIERFGEEAFIKDVWERYYYFSSPVDAGLVYDLAPYLRWPDSKESPRNS